MVSENEGGQIENQPERRTDLEASLTGFDLNEVKTALTAKGYYTVPKDTTVQVILGTVNGRMSWAQFPFILDEDTEVTMESRYALSNKNLEPDAFPWTGEYITLELDSADRRRVDTAYKAQVNPEDSDLQSQSRRLYADLSRAFVKKRPQILENVAQEFRGYDFDRVKIGIQFKQPQNSSKS